MTKEEIQRLIEAGLPNAQVRVTGDDGQPVQEAPAAAASAPTPTLVR